MQSNPVQIVAFQLRTFQGNRELNIDCHRSRLKTCLRPVQSIWERFSEVWELPIGKLTPSLVDLPAGLYHTKDGIVIHKGVVFGKEAVDVMAPNSSLWPGQVTVC